MTAGATSQNPFAYLRGESGGRYSLDAVEPLGGTHPPTVPFQHPTPPWGPSPKTPTG